MKRKKILLFIMLLLFPTLVLASETEAAPSGLISAIAIFIVETIFSVIIVIAIIIALIKHSKKILSGNNIPKSNNQSIKTKVNIVLKCTKCGNILNVNDKFCKKCGAAISGDNIQVVEDDSQPVQFDQTYLQSEKDILKKFIIEELELQGENEKNLITASLNKKKNILLLVTGIVMFIITLMYYFNYSLIFCIFLEAIVLLVYSLIGKRLNILNVLANYAIKNPNEDISTMVKTIREQKHSSAINGKLKLAIVILLVVLLPTIYFFKPRILYIRYSDGYSVLRYTRGIVNDDNIINIPETHKGKQVLTISESAFKNSDVEVVNIPNGLTAIKTKAFLNCKNLEKIEIPATVKEIRGRAFEDCENLTDVVLHEGLKEIRASVFKNNVNLVNIDLPDSLEYLGASAFSNCSSLTEITIPKNVIEINGQTFEYCTSLRTVNLHDDIISIHGEVFIGDSSLVNITLPPKITEVRGNTFEGCSSLTSIIIPEGVTRIGGHAFYGCTSLSNVTIPSTVIEIGSSAFRLCDSLYNVRVPYNTIINERAFKESPTYIERY